MGSSWRFPPGDVLVDDTPSQPATRAWARVSRLAKFGTVGAFGAIINLAALTLLVEVFSWRPWLAALVSIELSTLTNFALNRAWTWKDRRPDRWSIVPYHYATFLGVGVQWASVTFGVQSGIHYAVAAVAGIGLGSVLNYAANHYLTFGKLGPEALELRRRLALYGAAFALQLVGAALLTHDWDTFVFQRAVEDFLVRGQTPYQVGASNPDYIWFGTGVPTHPLWYAYPPLPLLMMSSTYWPMLAGLGGKLWIGRILVKLPFIASTLGFAYLARRIVASGADADPIAGRRVEKWLLFNPLFLIVAAVWGQFESALLCCLALSVLALRRDAWTMAGVWFGLASLLKIFTAYVAPVWLVFLWRRGGIRAPWRFFGAAAVTFLSVSLPFALAAPRGFLQQVLLMHSGRPPARFSPIAFTYEILKWVSRHWVGTLPGDVGLASTLTLLSFVLTAFVLGLMTFGSRRHLPTERALLLWTGLSFLGGLLATKIVSEQYMLLPIGTLALYAAHAGPNPLLLPLQRVRRLLKALTIGFVVAAIVDGVHFLVFIPEDVARLILPKSIPDTIVDVAWTFGMTPFEFRVLLSGVVAAVLVVPMLLAVRSVGPALIAGLEELGHVAARRLAVRPMSHHHLRPVLAVVFLLLLVPPLAVGALAPRREAAPTFAGAMKADRPVVLAHYRTDWFNPSSRPDFAGGTWPTSRFTPVAGYYNSIAHKAQEDFVTLRNAHVDALVINFQVAYETYAASVVSVAEDQHFPYALEVDLAQLGDEHGQIELTQSTARHARELLDGPPFGYASGGYHLRLAPDRAPVLLVAGLNTVQPSFSDREREYVADFLDGHPSGTSVLGGRSPSVWQKGPHSLRELLAGTPDGARWRAAYALARDQWWRTAFEFAVPQIPGQAMFEVLVDRLPATPLPTGLPVRVVGTYDPIGANSTSAASVIQSVTTVPGDVPGLAASWTNATANKPGAILFSWNDFELGQGAEPTVQGGSSLLAWLERARDEPTTPAMP